MPAIVAAVCRFQFGISLLLNTWFLSMLYSTPYMDLLLTRIPQVLVLGSYREARERAAQADSGFLFYENEQATTLQMAMTGFAGTTLSLLTGPEGGLEASEVEKAQEAGLQVCTLGKRILRCETAPLCALSAVMYATGEF